MLKKTCNVIATSALLLGLSACGNNNDKETVLNDLNNNRENSDISASFTRFSSNRYPHTKAVPVQDAKYKFVPVKASEEAEWQKEKQDQQQVQQQTPNVPRSQANTAGNNINNTNTNTSTNQFASEVINLTNQERAKSGLPALKEDTQLSGVAQTKCLDMQQNNYFSHTSPTYGSPFDMMRDFGVTYKAAGENIAQGQRTPQEVVQAWMNSEGHRRNIMSNSFTYIGVGFEQGGNHWTQMFIGK